MKKLLLNYVLLIVFLIANTQLIYAQYNTSDVSDNDLPFTPTTITNGAFATNTTWYKVTIDGSKYWEAKDGEIDCFSGLTSFNDYNYFCFVGNNTNGFKIYNKGFGAKYIMYCASSTSHEPLVPTQESYASTPNTFKLSTNSNGGYNFYYYGVSTACLNDLHGDGVVTLWTNTGAPSGIGSCINFQKAEDTGGNTGGGDNPDPVPSGEKSLNPVSGNVLYIFFNNGYVDAYPREYISEVRDNGSTFTVVDTKGGEYTYANSDVTTSEEGPETLPSITSFKFNNKFNDMLMVDATGEIVGDSTINISVGSIGKRLIPSFQTSEKDVYVFVDTTRQFSKVTSRRFEVPTTYTVCRPGYKMLRQWSDSTYERLPFGRDYVVTVDYLCDHPTTDYGVPVIYITTNDGNIITSKTTYKTGKIRIDGAGYFPDMEEMAMNIKGRGNSSWSTPSTGGWWGGTSDPKNPYHVKFDTKQKPLGMKAGKHWNIIANKQTGSMTTNAIGSRISEMVKTDGANHFIPVELFINGDYRGSYCLTEKVGLSNNSIDLDDESNATLLELDSYSSDFTTTAKFPSQGLPVTVHYPDFTDPTDTTNLTLTDIKNSFNLFATAVSNGSDLYKFIDVPSTARFLMVNDMIVNLEIQHPKSTFCYNENILTDSLYHFGPTWDFDWAFGYENGYNYYVEDADMNFFVDASSNLERKSFIQKLRYCGEEMDKEYYRVWTDFVNNHLDDLCEYCTDYYNVAKASFTHDNTKWYTGSNYQTITSNSITWLKKRAAYVYNYLSNTLGYADKGYLDPDPEPEPDIPDVIETASIRTVQGIYDMQGRRIDSDIKSLPSGLYIINGKKVLKR